MKKNNKGFTLIEILVSLAILAVVGGSVAGFMSISSKNYVSVNKEVGIQYESQIAVNQIKDLIIDANKGVSYGLEPVSGAFTLVDVTNQNSETELLAQLHAANPANVNKVKRCLLIYNENLKSDGTYEYPVVKIVWNPDTQKVYYVDKTYAVLADLEADPYLQSIPETNYKLLAEYTSNFSVDLFHLKDSQVDLKVTFQDQGKEYETTPTIALRNKVVVGDNLRTLYNNNNVSKPSLALRVIIKKAGVEIRQDTLLVGTMAEYTAEVEMQFGATSDNAVTWSLEGSSVPTGKTPSTVDQTGKVTVSPDETATTLVLKATSAKLSGQPGVVNITVDKIDNTRGYVQSVSLGTETITELEGNGTTGIYKMGYRYEFKDQAPYIVYVNESKVEATQRGVKWSLATTAPASSYTFNQTNGELIVTYAAQNHQFVITATARLPMPASMSYASDSRTVTPQNLSEKPKEPEVEIIADPSIDRNGSNDLTINVTEITKPEYSCRIIEYSPNFEPKQGWNPDNVLKSNVKIVNPTSKNPSIQVLKQLDWDQDFWVKVRVTVRETAAGSNYGKTVTKDTIFNLGAVKVEVEARDGTVMRYADTMRKIKFKLTNYQNYTNGIDCKVTLYRSWGDKETGLTITSESYSEDIKWDYDENLDMLTIYLSNNGRSVLQKGIKNKERFDKMRVECTYTNRYSGKSESIVLPVEFTFEYQK